MLIGDLLIDRTYYVNVSKLSPEAPIPVAMLTGEPINTPGGAGLAAAFSAVKKIPIIFGTYTCPKTAVWILQEYNIPVIYTDTRSFNVNATKIRYIDNERYYHLLRVDSDNIINPPFSSPGEEDEWFSRIKKNIKNNNIGIMAILDYRKGLLNESRSQRLISMAHSTNIPVYVDSRAQDLRKFRGADILKLNSTEYKTTCSSLKCKTSHELCNRLNIKQIIETKGADGAELWDSYNPSFIGHVPNLIKREGSPDVTGCGDVFDVTFCHEWGINKVGFHKAIKAAVEAATKFAYEPIEKRLHLD